MATMTTVTLVDDLDGSEAIESVSFALDGASYEIDLNEKNARKLRDSLAGYVVERASGRRRPPRGRPRGQGAHRSDLARAADRSRSRADGCDPRVGAREWARGVRARPTLGERPRGVRGRPLSDPPFGGLLGCPGPAPTPPSGVGAGLFMSAPSAARVARASSLLCARADQLRTARTNVAVLVLVGRKSSLSCARPRVGSAGGYCRTKKSKTSEHPVDPTGTMFRRLAEALPRRPATAQRARTSRRTRTTRRSTARRRRRTATRADENDDFRHFSPKTATLSRAGRS